MTRIIDDRAGEHLALEDASWSLRIDRRDGALTCVQTPLIGRPREQRLSLERIRRIELQISNLPGVSLDMLKGLFQQVRETSNPAAVAPHAQLSKLPRSARVRIEEDGRGLRSEVRISLEGAPTVASDARAATGVYVALAFRMAAAAGLPYATVATIPHTGTYVELARERGGGAVEVPAGQGASGGDLDHAAARAWEHAHIPPFDPRRFSSDHQVTAWEPSSRVEFHRRLSRAAYVVLPFPLFLLAGPALLVGTGVTGTPLDLVALSVATVFGLAIGGVALLVLSFLLPRTVTLDWNTRTIAIRTWRGAEAITFDDLDRLELKGEHHTSSGGESGSRSTTYCCRLEAVCRDGAGTPCHHELVATTHLKDPDEPYRQAVPLLTDLAGALQVEGCVLEYSFRR